MSPLRKPRFSDCWKNQFRRTDMIIFINCEYVYNNIHIKIQINDVFGQFLPQKRSLTYSRDIIHYSDQIYPQGAGVRP